MRSLDKHLARIEELSLLEAGWDGDRKSKPPSELTVDRVESLVRHCGLGWEFKIDALGEKGGLYLAWDAGLVREQSLPRMYWCCDLTWYNSGRIRYSASLDGANDISFDMFNRAPSEIAAFLKFERSQGRA